MKYLWAIFFTLAVGSALFAFTLSDRSWFAALKESDLVFVGTASEMTIIEIPKATRERIDNHGRLKVQVKRIVWPVDAKSEKIIEIDFGYNVGSYAADGYKNRELVYVVKQQAKDSKSVIVRAHALRWWHFAYRPEDLDQVLDVRKKLQDGASPKSLEDKRPKELFSAGR